MATIDVILSAGEVYDIVDNTVQPVYNIELAQTVDITSIDIIDPKLLPFTLINDSSILSNKTYSSRKIEALVSTLPAIVSSQIIDDSIDHTDKVYSSQKTQSLHNLQAEAIANLATGQAKIVNTTTPIFALTAVEQQVPFTVSIDSTDASVFTIDDVNNTVTFLKDASYNFISSIIIQSSTNSPVTLVFNIRNASDNSLITTSSGIYNIQNGRTESSSINTLITVGKNGIPSAPLTIKIYAVADIVGYTFNSFSSILASSSSYSLTTEASGIHVAPVGNIASTNVQSALAELDSEKASIVGNQVLSATDALSVSSTTVTLHKGDGTTDSITTQDTIYTHPTTDGNLHVPATGTTNNGKVLTAGATAGTFTWETPTSGGVQKLKIFSTASASLMPISSGIDFLDPFCNDLASAVVSPVNVCYASSLYIVNSSSSTTNYITSPDAKTWTERTSLPSAAAWYIGSNGTNLFMAATVAGSVYTSSDGLSWTVATSLPTTAQTSNAQPVYYNGIWLIAGSVAGTVYYSSDNGVTWGTQTGLSTLVNRTLSTYSGGFYYIISTTSVAVSNNGTSWSTLTIPAMVSATVDGISILSNGYIAYKRGTTYVSTNDFVTFTTFIPILGIIPTTGGNPISEVNGVYFNATVSTAGFGYCNLMHVIGGRLYNSQMISTVSFLTYGIKYINGVLFVGTRSARVGETNSRICTITPADVSTLSLNAYYGDV